LDEREPRHDLLCPVRLDDRRIIPLDPRAVGGRDPYRAPAERPAPFDHHAVEVRMRECDARDAAHRADRLDALRVDEAEAVPEEVATGRSHEQGALPDADR